MALIYWMTCNGNLNNSGMGDTTWTDNFISLADGKTGKCVQFSENANHWTTVLSLNPTDSITVSLWHRISVTDANTTLISWKLENGSYIDMTQNGTVFATTGLSGTDTGSWHSTDYDWAHIVYEYNKDTSTHRIFINGFEALKDVSNLGSKITGVRFGSGDFCDIRIYDEYISTKHAKIISRGLICRYNLGNPTYIPKFGLSDHSGFDHKAVPGNDNVALTWSSDCPVGYGSFSPNNANYLKCEHVSFSTNNLSFMIWVHFDNWASLTGKYGIISLSGIDTGIYIENGKLKTSVSVISEDDDENKTTLTSQSEYSVSALKPGWHHFSINIILNSWDSVRTDIFIDGDVANYNTDSSDSYMYLTFNNPETAMIYIGALADKTPMPSGKLSDFRMYVTTQYDYKLFYEAKVSADDQGNLYAYGLEQKEANDETSFSGAGLVGGQIIEGDDHLRFYPNDIRCKEYIEI